MRQERIDASQLELEEKVVSIKRVTKVVKGGRNMRFTALVVVGDKKMCIRDRSQIKEAVEKMFDGTKVAKVNTMNCEGKKKRVRGTFKYGKTAATKKAIVQLTEDSKDIEIFQGL